MKVFELEDKRAKFRNDVVLKFLNNYAIVKQSDNVGLIKEYDVIYKSICDSVRKSLNINNAISLFPINESNDKFVGINIFDIEVEKIKKVLSVYEDYETGKYFIEVEM